MVKSRTDLTGKRFGRLTVIYQTDDYVNRFTGQRAARWHCMCDCGNEYDTLGTSLLNNKVHSCGCYSNDIKRAVHKKFNRYDLLEDIGIGYTEKGEKFYFDPEDYHKIKNHSWHLCDGYVVAGNNVKMHRIITDCGDGDEVDHVNHRTNDNRKRNLRVGTHQENMMNKRTYKNNTSGVPGVTWSKSHKQWHSRIQVKGDRIELGYYDDLDAAKQVRKDAEATYFHNY